MLVLHCVASCLLEQLREQIFQKNTKSAKWRWTSYGINRISWRLGGRHTQRLARRPFISACVSLQQRCGFAIDLESLRTRQRQKRLFNLAASDNLHETGLFFRFHRLHNGCTEFGIGFKYGQIFQKKRVKSTKWRWTSYGINRISWRLGGRHTQRLSSMPLISACVSLQQRCGFAIDL